MTETPFFEQPEDNLFVARDPARGPWSKDAVHAGPVSGLVARALEAEIPDKHLTRLTLDFVQTIPMQGFRIEAERVRNGRTLATGRARVFATDGTLCVEAVSTHLAARDPEPFPGAGEAPAPRDAAIAGAFPVTATLHGRPAFADFIDIAYPAGETPAPGPTALWMRTPPLLPDERPSPFQSLCPLADCGSGISRNSEIDRVTFMNTDLTIVAHRRPRKAWLLSRAHSFWQSDGIGLAQAEIADAHGPVATVLQTLLLRPTPR